MYRLGAVALAGGGIIFGLVATIFMTVCGGIGAIILFVPLYRVFREE